MKKILGREQLEGGQCIPRWYLPVYKEDYRMTYICYPFFIAPFVLLCYIIHNIWRNLWRDLLEWNRDLEKFWKAKKKA